MGKKKESAGESAMPAKVAQPHGGALYAGGVPGNAGGGRPPSEVREALRESFADRVPLLRDIADGVVRFRLLQVCEHCGEEPSEPPSLEEIERAIPGMSERLKAMDIMAKYGDIAPKSGLNEDDVRQRLKMTLLVVQDELDEDDAERLIGRLRTVWK